MFDFLLNHSEKKYFGADRNVVVDDFVYDYFSKSIDDTFDKEVYLNYLKYLVDDAKNCLGERFIDFKQNNSKISEGGNCCFVLK